MLLNIKNLSGFRNGITLWSNLNIQIRSAQILWITGPNGIGKSTLLRILAGLNKQYRGDIKLNIAGKIHPVPQNCSYLANKYAMHEELSVIENIISWRRILLSNENIDYIKKLLSLDMIMNHKFCELSSGQKKRVSFSRLLLTKSPMWLLDEPLAALDTKSKKIICDIIDKKINDGGIILITSHLPCPFKDYQLLSLSNNVV